MKISQVLTEGLSDVLYHYTDLNALGQILVSNSLRLTPDIGTEAEVSRRRRGKMYYMSFARSKTGDYHFPVSTHAGGAVLLVVDGRQLKQDGFSGAPVDYWGFGNKDEMEDRLYSRKPRVENANKYITEIHTYFYKEASDQVRNAKQISSMRKAYIVAKKLDIKMYVYDNAKDFGLLNKAKTVQISTLKSTEQPDKPRGERKPRNYFKPYVELLMVNDKSKLTPDARSKLYNMDGWNQDDAVRTLAADIHNSRTGSYRADLDKFLAVVKQQKLSSVKQIVNHIIQKFKDN